LDSIEVIQKIETRAQKTENTIKFKHKKTNTRRADVGNGKADARKETQKWAKAGRSGRDEAMERRQRGKGGWGKNWCFNPGRAAA